jgi:signal transduction histidine kinase
VDASQQSSTRDLWLTWLLALLILAAGSIASSFLRDFNNSLLLYLPSALGIILVHWLGLRVLPLTFVNSLFTLYLWHVSGGWLRYAFLASHEPAIALASWLLSRHLIQREQGFSGISAFIQFTFLGLALPDTVNCFYTYHYSFVDGDWTKITLLWLADFITMFCIGIPVLHLLKPSRQGNLISLFFINLPPKQAVRQMGRELLVVLVFFLTLNFIIDFREYWFVYGICATVIAVARGFEFAVLTNFILFSLSYLSPLILLASPSNTGTSQMLNVHLGMAAMFIVSALIGRVVSDFRKNEVELTDQKRKLESANELLNKTNRELDRFVYSVSHDISAPLKSIKGLVSLSRLENDPTASRLYMDKIDTSVHKLERFVEEVLDHSRSSRKEVTIESIRLESFVAEILENLKYLENFDHINFSFDFRKGEIFSDRFLLKVVLSNLLSNAVKYQKRYQDHRPEIKLGSSVIRGHHEIEIADNGEGIPDDHKAKIFDMFYRGTTSSPGSGLGLYIAREAMERLKGTIKVDTVYGKGSTFTLVFPMDQSI